MRILFLSTWFPYPLDQGSKIRAYYLLRSLAEQHEVALASYEDVELKPEWRHHIEKMCARVFTLPRRPFTVSRIRSWLGWLSPMPSAVVGMYSNEMAELVQRAAREWQPQVIVALTFVTAPYALKTPGALKVVDIDNYMARMLMETISMADSAVGALRRRLAYVKFLQYEKSLYRKFDLCLAVTSTDRELVVRELKLTPNQVAVVPNGVDLSWYQCDTVVKEANTLIYNGALTYQANFDAMEYFLRAIFPKIIDRYPQARLKITGRTEGVNLNELRLNDHVEFTGYVEDIRPVVASSAVCVAPLRMGGGTRLKILEAMALGVPVVSTTKGAEGLDVQHERQILIADAPDEFAGQVLRLLESAQLREEIAQNALELVKDRYDWKRIGGDFCASIESLFTQTTL
jgi:glycosyltransferase involved in cell wall biosynthesis